MAIAKQRSVAVDWPRRRSVYDHELTLVDRDGQMRAVSHPKVAYWRRFATWSPDRKTIAVAGSTIPFVKPSGPILSGPSEPEPSVLALIDTTLGTVTICDGTFDDFCYRRRGRRQEIS